MLSAAFATAGDCPLPPVALPPLVDASATANATPNSEFSSNHNQNANTAATYRSPRHFDLTATPPLSPPTAFESTPPQYPPAPAPAEPPLPPPPPRAPAPRQSLDQRAFSAPLAHGSGLAPKKEEDYPIKREHTPVLSRCGPTAYHDPQVPNPNVANPSASPVTLHFHAQNMHHVQASPQLQHNRPHDHLVQQRQLHYYRSHGHQQTGKIQQQVHTSTPLPPPLQPQHTSPQTHLKRFDHELSCSPVRRDMSPRRHSLPNYMHPHTHQNQPSQHETVTHHEQPLRLGNVIQPNHIDARPLPSIGKRAYVADNMNTPYTTTAIGASMHRDQQFNHIQQQQLQQQYAHQYTPNHAFHSNDSSRPTYAHAEQLHSGPPAVVDDHIHRRNPQPQFTPPSISACTQTGASVQHAATSAQHAVASFQQHQASFGHISSPSTSSSTPSPTPTPPPPVQQRHSLPNLHPQPPPPRFSIPAADGKKVPEKKYKCSHDGCNKAFARPYSLRVHQRKHSSDLPYPCKIEGCNFFFKWRSSQSHHMHSRHAGKTIVTGRGAKKRTVVLGEKRVRSPPPTRHTLATGIRAPNQQRATAMVNTSAPGRHHNTQLHHDQYLGFRSHSVYPDEGISTLHHAQQRPFTANTEPLLQHRPQAPSSSKRQKFIPVNDTVPRT